VDLFFILNLWSIFIVYEILLFGFWDLFGENRKNRVKRGDFDMVLEEDLDMVYRRNGPVLIGGI
jgi:hypothetical protein